MNIEKLKQKVLDHAIRGKLVAQNINDEPVSELVKLMRQKKEKLIKKGKIKKNNEKSYIFKGEDNCYYEKIGSNKPQKLEDLPFDIPNNWTWIRFKDISLFGMGQTILKSEMSNKGTPVYSATINDIPLGFIDEEKNKIKLTKNDLVIPARGNSIGCVTLVNDLNASCTQTTVWMKLFCKEIVNFVITFIKGCKNTIFIREGSAIPQITISKIERILLPLPPLQEQIRIMKVYDEILKKIQLIENNYSNLNKLVPITKQKILDYFFGSNSSYKSYYNHRTKTTLSKLVDKDKIGDGDWVLSENMDDNGEYSLIQLKHIGNNEYLNKPYNHINKNFFNSNNCTEIKSGYILISRLISNNMHVCILPDLDFKCITSVDVCWIAPSNNYNQKYLMYYLLSPEFQNEVLLKSSGSGRKRISKKNLCQIELNIHNNKYQQIIVEQIDEMFRLIDSFNFNKKN